MDIPLNIWKVFQGVQILKTAAKTNPVWSAFPLENAGLSLSE